MNQHEGTIVKGTNILAAGGLTFPAWLPSLETINGAAALLVSILSAVWLLLQIRKALHDKGEKA